MLVWPKNDQIRKLITHPSGNIAFHEQGPIDWPDDSFTYRRIMDGDVTVEEPKATRQEPKVVVQEEPKAAQQAPATKKPDSR